MAASAAMKPEKEQCFHETMAAAVADVPAAGVVLVSDAVAPYA